MKKVFNDYDDLLPKWQVDQIITRAKAMHFRHQDIEDALQEIVPVVMEFRFNAAKSNGATETTVLTRLIDNQLCKFRRNGDRYDRCKLRAESNPIRPLEVESHEAAVDLAIDLKTLLDALPQKERLVCDGLSRGQSVRNIAVAMGVSDFEVKRLIRVCREKITAAGLAPKEV